MLGSITIGDHSKIGAGSVVLHNVPQDSTVVGIPGRVVRQNGVKVHHHDLNHTDLPDPVADKMQRLERQIEALQNEVQKLSALQKEKE
ncbi:serine acetyltransferase [Sporolactobacillus inulinus]|uniref:Serine acetyltransferase n=1 Tax=Sporolactobacillus inulinus TaxID=2078 RepID=A0A4Y1ZF21_9BACL|nr:serine acetyltransferase [Sporolactobacillus inulinus]